MVRIGAMIFSLATVAAFGCASASSGFAAAPSDADYVDALVEVNRVQAERKVAVEQLERLRREREAAQADLNRRQEEASGTLKQAKDAAIGALDAFLKEPDPGNPEAELLQSDLRAALLQQQSAEAEVKRIRADQVEAQSQIAFIKINAGKIKEKIVSDKGALSKEQARLKRIESGDQAALEDLAKQALQEKEAVTAALRIFDPPFKAAQVTSRIAIGIHLPDMYRAKRDIDAIKSSLCGVYTIKARKHIGNGLKGIETFLVSKESDAIIILQDAIRNEPTEQESNCNRGIADAGAEEARRNIRSLEAAIAGQEGEILHGASMLEALEETIAKAGPEIARQEDIQREGKKRADLVNLKLVERAVVWDAAAAERHKKRQEREQELRQDVENAGRAYEAALAPFLTERQGLPSTKEVTDRVASLTTTLFKKEEDAENKLNLFTRSLAYQEVISGTRLELTHRDTSVSQVCASIYNETSMAFSEIYLEITYDGQELPEISKNLITFNKSFSFLYQKDSHTTNSEISSQAGKVTFNKINRYSEAVPYLLPRTRSEVLCANIANALTGDSLRELEKLGFDGNLHAFGLRIAEFEPYDGSVSEESKAAKDLRPVNFKARYRAPIDRAKEKAAARTRAQAKPSGQPAAPGAVAGEPEAVIDRKQAANVQAALIQAGFLKGSADGVLGEKSRDAIRKWQAANGHAVTGQLTASQAAGLAAISPADKAADPGMIAGTIEGWISQEDIGYAADTIATIARSGERDLIVVEVESCYKSAIPSRNFKSKRYCITLDTAATIFNRTMSQQGFVEYQFFSNDNFMTRFNAAIDDSGLDRRQIDEVSKRITTDVGKKLAQEVVRRQPK